MKNKYNILVTAFLAMWLAIGVTACSDSSSSSDDSEENCNALALPSELTPATITIEYFSSQNVPQDEEHSVYHQVKTIALSGNGLLSFGGNTALISSFLSAAPGLNIQPEAQGGNCVWNVNFAEDYPQFGIQSEVTVIASQVNDGVNWQVKINGEFGEETVEDFLFLEGFTSGDESTGEWNFYTPENPNDPVSTYTWDIESDDDYELNLDVFEQGATVATANYVRSDAENNMIFSSEGQATTEIHWNEDTDSGWLEEDGGERMCYTNFVNSACS